MKNLNYVSFLLMVVIYFLITTFGGSGTLNAVDGQMALITDVGIVGYSLAVFFTSLTSFAFLLFVALLTLLVLFIQNDRKAWYYLTSVIVGSIFLSILPDYYGVISPEPLLGFSDFSFPSVGLAGMVFIGSLTLFYLREYVHVGSNALFALLIVVVGFSQIILKTHWYTDVLAGVVIGGLLTFVFLELECYFQSTLTSSVR